MISKLSEISKLRLITPLRNLGTVIISLKFVCVSGNKIPAEQKHQFGRGFHQMIAYRIESDYSDISDLGSNVKVTVT